MSINHFNTDLTRPDRRHVSEAWRLDKNHLKKSFVTARILASDHMTVSMLRKKTRQIQYDDNEKFIATVQKTPVSLI